jgi:hypothetical protein
MRQTNYQSQGAPQPGQARLSLADRIAAVISEYNYAQRRLTQLRLAPARYGSDHNRAPGTYPEFLFLTSGWLTREPSARERASS